MTLPILEVKTLTCLMASVLGLTLQGGELKGTVTTRSGHPLKGAVIAVTPEVPNALSDGDKAAKVTGSDRQGHFALTDLPGGSYGLTATLPGYEGTFLGKVEVPPTGRGSKVTVRMPKGGFPLSFRPGKTCEGWPQGTVFFLARASDVAGDLFYMPLRKGRYQVNLGPGQYYLHAEAPGCDPVEEGFLLPQQAGLYPIPLAGFGTAPGLRKELLAMVEEDQAERIVTDRPAKSPEACAQAQALREERVRAILNQNGWPTQAQVGGKGVGAIWLIVHHSETLLPERIGDICKAADDEELDKGLMATSLDRVLRQQGKLQRYGTQMCLDSMEPYPMEDPEHVDARRQSVGLEPLEAYLVAYRKAFQVPATKPGSGPSGPVLPK